MPRSPQMMTLLECHIWPNEQKWNRTSFNRHVKYVHVYSPMKALGTLAMCTVTYQPGWNHNVNVQKIKQPSWQRASPIKWRHIMTLGLAEFCARKTVIFSSKSPLNLWNFYPSWRLKYTTRNAFQHCAALRQHVVFVVSGAAGCWLVERLCVSGSLAFWLLVLHVVFVVSRNPAFWLLLLHVVLLSCILIGWVPFFSSRWQDFLLSLHSNWLSGLEKKEVSIVEMASNSFVISEINLYQSYLKASI